MSAAPGRGPGGAHDLRHLHMLFALRRKFATSLRYKVLALVLVPIFLIALITMAFVVYWSQGFSQDQLLRRVITDLNVAKASFLRLQRDYLNDLQRLAGSHAFYTAYASGDLRRIQDQIAAVRHINGFDFLHVTDRQGVRMFEGVAQDFDTSVNRRSPLPQLVNTWGSPQVGIEIYSAEDLARESGSLVSKARLPLIETPHATPSERRFEDRAMVIHAVAPVHDPNGTVVALLDGGVVLNNSFGLVDGIRNLVYGPESLPHGSSGAVTLFLDDVRISTNVPLRAGERALGTRVSDEVRESVLERGNAWVDYAFVVNDWYISAYEPIYDVNGERVGMLYAGFLEAPFRHTYYETLAFALLLLLLCTTFAALVVVRGAKAIFAPIEGIASVVRDIRKGEDRRVGQLAKDDEIGELARQLDETLNLLKLRNDEIRQAAARLESQVDNRTRELREKNLRLEETIGQLRATREQLVVAEKLAALGELTAGVAHEINNPIAVIQGNMELLRRMLGSRAGGVEMEMDLIMQQVARIHAIVDKLLRYSRASTYEAELEEVDTRSVIEDTLPLTEHETSAKSIRVARTHEASNRIFIDRHELQQVLVNLLVNAVQASEQGGTIDVLTRDWNDDGTPGGVVIAVRDRGRGIKPEHLARVFDPFFTTRKVGGTGLGLSVSYGLIRRYGGDIRVTSEEGRGATFEVFLPSNSAMTREARRDVPANESARSAAAPGGDINERRYL